MDCDDVIGKANSITPVPGGVGPMTITMLLYNTILAAVGDGKFTKNFGLALFRSLILKKSMRGF